MIADTANLLQALFDRHGGDGSTFIMFVLVLIAPIVILNRIIRHETVGLETILGAICVYVLIGIAFAGIYGGVNDAEPTGFFAQHVVAEQRRLPLLLVRHHHDRRVRRPHRRARAPGASSSRSRR